MSILHFTPSLLSVSDKLHALINKQLQTSIVATTPNSETLSINFRDRSYSAEEGGYHPVEIGLKIENNMLNILYITDFAFMGNHYPELERCIDFDFGNQVAFSVATGWQSIRSEGIDELYKMWEHNFLHYVEAECYDEIAITH